ncbi:MAG: substrate-binding domain-containing protein [Betaproteobacteria bacterium]
MPPQIVVALLDERQEYHRMQAAEARAAAARAGLSLEVVFAESNAVLQIHQVFKHVHAAEGERPLAIVVQSVTGEGLARVARNAVAAGVGWIILNRRVDYVSVLRGQRPDLPIGGVTPDQEEIGRIHARQVRTLGPKQGLLLYVQGPPDTSAAQDRLRATREGLAGAPFRFKVVNGDWSEASGESAVAGWLRLTTSERPALLVAQNDAMATGARRAVLAHDRSWAGIPFLGCDGLPQGGQRLVDSGELAATVVMPATAGTAVELIARWQRDRQPPPEEVVLAPRSFPPEDRLRLR